MSFLQPRRTVRILIPNGSQDHWVTVKFVELVPVPSAVVIAIGPVVAPLGTVATTWLLVSWSNAADIPLKVTLVAPLKVVPVIVTDVPTGPLGGVKLLMKGVTA